MEATAATSGVEKAGGKRHRDRPRDTTTGGGGAAKAGEGGLRTIGALRPVDLVDLFVDKES